MTDSTSLATTSDWPTLKTDTPGGFADVAWLAKVAANTHGLVPDGLRGKPGEVLMALLAGQELGLGYAQTLKQVHVIGGQVGFSAELLRARILQAGHQLAVVTYTDELVCVHGRRRDGTHLTVDWDLDRAKRAGLKGDAWTKYPRSMLLARATSELARAIFPDCTIGLLSYSADESAEVHELDVPMFERLEPDADGQLRVVDVGTGEVVDVDDADDAEWVADAKADE